MFTGSPFCAEARFESVAEEAAAAVLCEFVGDVASGIEGVSRG